MRQPVCSRSVKYRANSQFIFLTLTSAHAERDFRTERLLIGNEAAGCDNDAPILDVAID